MADPNDTVTSLRPPVVPDADATQLGFGPPPGLRPLPGEPAPPRDELADLLAVPELPAGAVPATGAGGDEADTVDFSPPPKVDPKDQPTTILPGGTPTLADKEVTRRGPAEDDADYGGSD